MKLLAFTVMDPIDLYLSVREKEGRLYPDEVVSRLPEYQDRQPLSSEWRSRADSCALLTRYLAAQKSPLSLLELGCGNGWLSNRLALIPSVRICGLDRFSSELAQAARVFNRPNLFFLSADIFSAPFTPQSIDVIVLASVIQYFPDLPRLIQSLKLLLTPNGEIHLIDSPLYLPGDLPAARERTREYYASLGYPEMTGHYYHHLVSDLEKFSPRWLYRPGKLFSRIQRITGKVVSPFPWLVIR